MSVRQAGGYREIQLVGPLIERLLLLESVIEDLRWSSRCLGELNERISNRATGTPTTDFDVVQIALWQAAVVAYARCYVSGRRKGIAHLFLPTGHTTYHKDLMDIRATHLAHMDRDSKRESTSVTVQLREQEDKLTFKIDTRGVKELLPTSVALQDYLATVVEARAAAEGAYHETIASMRDALAQLPPSDMIEAALRGRPITVAMATPVRRGTE
jgi:hypothetical protein